jgi:hypothetical protein
VTNYNRTIAGLVVFGFAFALTLVGDFDYERIISALAQTVKMIYYGVTR